MVPLDNIVDNIEDASDVVQGLQEFHKAIPPFLKRSKEKGNRLYQPDLRLARGADTPRVPIIA